MADLLTLADYKLLLGVDPTDTTSDLRIAALIPAASRAILAYTDRDFSVTTGVSSIRTFQYDGSGFLEINDCTSVVDVSTNSGVSGQLYPLDQNAWTAQPDRGEVFYYLIIHGGTAFGMSPEMGFERNLDTLGVLYKPVLMTVTAVWGWPAVPPDVKLAAAWTIEDALGQTAAGPLVSESIAGYSRAWAPPASGDGGMLAIPNRARDILANYERAY